MRVPHEYRDIKYGNDNRLCPHYKVLEDQNTLRLNGNPASKIVARVRIALSLCDTKGLKACVLAYGSPARRQGQERGGAPASAARQCPGGPKGASRPFPVTTLSMLVTGHCCVSLRIQPSPVCLRVRLLIMLSMSRKYRCGLKGLSVSRSAEAPANAGTLHISRGVVLLAHRGALGSYRSVIL